MEPPGLKVPYLPALGEGKPGIEVALVLLFHVQNERLAGGGGEETGAGASAISHNE